MIKFLMIIFMIRPVIDLFWDINIGPLNVAGVIAITLSALLYFSFFIYLKKKRVFLNKTTIVFIIYCSIITFFNFNQVTDLDNLFRIISATIFILIIPRNISIEQLERMMKYFVIFTLIPIMISYLQAIGIIPYTYWDYLPSGTIGRASGGYRQPSVLTRFLTLANLYSLYFLSKYKDQKKIRRKYKIFIVLSLISIFLSYHRTAYLINILILLFWFGIENKKNLKNLISKSFLIVVIGVLAIVILNYFDMISITLEDLNKMMSIDNIFQIEDNKIQLVLRGRGGIIDLLLDNIRNAPWYFSLLGNGVNINRYTGIQMYVADMDWIRVVWNFGIIGGLIWICQILSFIKIILRAYKSNCDRYICYIGVGALLIYIAFGFTIEATTTPNLMYHIYLIIGFIGVYLEKNKLCGVRKNDKR